MAKREKILCLVFKFLGDVAVSIPALRALREARPEAEIHLLVADDAAPLVTTLPWLDRVWALPRTRGKARLRDTWPVLRALRREKFDLSIDLVGNDRGALLSFGAGARKKIGVKPPGGFLGRSKLYHHVEPEAPLAWHESRRHLHLLEKLGARPEARLDLELRADPAEAEAAAKVLPNSAIIGHVSTSKPLKEWPMTHWRRLAELARADGIPLVFAAGPSPREREDLARLADISPETPQLPVINGLALYLAVLRRSRLLVSGDTGPMHFAAGLGVPTLSLFGPSYVHQWAPIAPLARHLKAPGCECSPDQAACTARQHCLAGLSPETVWHEIRSMLASPTVSAEASGR